MKVFISHSSRDKWIARKLSEEIIGLGCETFLDEKDIETGESIDESIHEHLNDSDDFLLLLSPDSIKSHWVLIELGGALALKKRIVIVLIYLGANDIPQPISKYLARDINEINKYYDEVNKKLSYKTPKQVKRKVKKKVVKRKAVPKKVKLKVGNTAKLISTPQYKTRHRVGWNEDGDMDEFCGQIVTISEIHEEADFAHIVEDKGEYYWALDWLTKAS